ncbi:hypothetical protein C2845_PM09G17750 [Panicum miliaceum]|uniref:BED-type domain-containing protein n=1 Tax=Panicum miliaceum TaxID=4540 RepID=A0A3L6S1P3_PANMI|nr:hypothetical protein C2845_PM09G17750 [Panicum miliaceum]
MDTPSSASQAPSSDQGPAPAAGVVAAAEAGATANAAISIPESQGTDTDVEVVDSRRKLKSVGWKEFTRVQINGVWKAECMWCKDRLGGDTKNGTTHLHDHLKICQSRACRKVLKQSTLRMATAADGTVIVEKYIFDQEVVREELALMICVHEYPLSMVNHTGFRKFCAAMQPLFRVPSQNTMRTDILDMHVVQKKSIVKYFQQLSSRVAITTDMWTANHQKKGYMAVTAHYIDDKWEPKSFLLRFIYVPAPHTAEVVVDVLHEVLVDCHLERKISKLHLTTVPPMTA